METVLNPAVLAAVRLDTVHANKLRLFKFKTTEVKAEFLIELLPETLQVIRIQMKCNVLEYATSLIAMVVE